MKKKYKYSIVIGRFQPLHNGHIELINHARSIAESTIIIVGSANKPITPKNPFSAIDRRHMISKSLADYHDIHIIAVNDYMYNDEKWISQVNKAVSNITGDIEKSDICLVGHKKDESSWYLDMFVWHFKDYYSENFNTIHATDVRESIYTEKNLSYVYSKCPPNISNYISYLFDNDYFKSIIEEHKFNIDYRKTVSQYPRIEQTADTVVVQSGHVLLIQRKHMPGAGLWALPGGFVGQKETVLQAAMRELVEETYIDVPVKTLYANLENREGVRFDHPDRDPRGRIVTTTFRIHLPHIGKLTKVKGSDDAEKAEWKSFAWIENNTKLMYADHSEIIERMIGDL